MDRRSARKTFPIYLIEKLNLKDWARTPTSLLQSSYILVVEWNFRGCNFVVLRSACRYYFLLYSLWSFD